MWFRCFEEEISISIHSIMGSTQHLLLIPAVPPLDLSDREAHSLLEGQLGELVRSRSLVSPQERLQSLGVGFPKTSTWSSFRWSGLPGRLNFPLKLLVSFC